MIQFDCGTDGDRHMAVRGEYKLSLASQKHEVRWW